MGGRMVRSAMKTGFLIGLAFALGLVMAATIRVCLVAGLVVVLRPALGLGGARLSGGVSAIIPMIAALRLTRALPRPAQPSTPRDAALARALRDIFTPLGGRLALGGIGFAPPGLGLLPPGPRGDRPE